MMDNKCPLSGDICNNKKDCHLTESINGKSNIFLLCNKCAKNYFNESPRIKHKVNKEDKEAIKMLSDLLTFIRSEEEGGNTNILHVELYARELQIDLKKSIKEENFELSAELNKKINEYEAYKTERESLKNKQDQAIIEKRYKTANKIQLIINAIDEKFIKSIKQE